MQTAHIAPLVVALGIISGVMGARVFADRLLYTTADIAAPLAFVSKTEAKAILLRGVIGAHDPEAKTVTVSVLDPFDRKNTMQLRISYDDRTMFSRGPSDSARMMPRLCTGIPMQFTIIRAPGTLYATDILPAWQSRNSCT